MPFKRLSGDRNTASTLLLWSTCTPRGARVRRQGSTGRYPRRAGTAMASGGQGWPVNRHSSVPAIVALSFTSSVKKLPRYFLLAGAGAVDLEVEVAGNRFVHRRVVPGDGDRERLRRVADVQRVAGRAAGREVQVQRWCC